jgi:hypothetical protein
MGLLDELFGIGSAPSDPWSTLAEQIVFAPDGAGGQTAVRAPEGWGGTDSRVPANAGMLLTGAQMPQLPPPMVNRAPPSLVPVPAPAQLPAAAPAPAPQAAAPSLVPQSAPARPSPMQPPSLVPAAVRAAPAPAPAMDDGPSFMDRFAAFAAGGQNGLLSALSGAFHGADKMHAGRKANYDALVSRGLDPAMAQAVVSDPALMRQVIPQLFGRNQRQVLSPGQTLVDDSGRVIAQNSNVDASRVPAGWERGPDGRMTYVPGGPADPDYIARTSGARKQISATEMRAINEAEDAIPALQGTMETLDAARGLNSKAFSGLGAETGATIGTSGVPGAGLLVDTDRAKATSEWMKLMKPEAIQNMASTLKGATTNFELQEFVRLLSDPYTPVDVRGRIIARMKTLAERQMDVAKTRLDQMRDRTYYQPGGGSDPTGAPTGAPASDAPPAPRQTAPTGNLGLGSKVTSDRLGGLPDGTQVKDANGREYVIRGGQPVPVQ